MSFLLAYGAEKLVHKLTEKKRRSSRDCSDVFLLPTSMDDVIYELRRNALIELRLGWHDSSSLTSARSLTALAKALKHNTSLRRVSIGWHWQKRRELLFQVLVTLADSIRPHQLQSIQLCLNDWVPANVLARFLHSQTSLSSLDLQVVTVQTTPWKGLPEPSSSDATSRTHWSLSPTEATNSTRPACSSSGRGSPSHKPRRSKKAKTGVSTRASFGCVKNVVPLLLESFETNYYMVLSELRLVDCDLDDAAISLLSEDIMASYLSLRGNRRLTGRGCSKLIRNSEFASLDLSLCDLSANDFVLIAQALKDRKKNPLQELFLCGNYRMELMGLWELMQVCPFVVDALDLSFCDLSEAMTICVLQTLVQFGNEERMVQAPVRLRRLSLHGCRSASTEVTNTLVTLLRQNSPPLRALALEDTKNDRKYLSAKQMNQIADAMRHNYEMEDLSFDFFKSYNEQQAWKEIEHYQGLNRAGRRLLRPQPQNSSAVSTSASDVAKAHRAENDAWIQLLNAIKADHSFDDLYWVVRNSPGRFGRR